MKVSKRFKFDSAHYLPTFPEEHKCRRLHGHTFRVEIILEGEVENKKGYLMDFNDIKSRAEKYVEMLDHRCINEVGEETNDELLKNPTAENLARWFWKKLKPELPLLQSVILHETDSSYCVFDGK